MSKLIDQIINERENQIEINGKWYIAKPLNKIPFILRLKDAVKIMTNKAQAYHYKEDEM